MGLDCGAGARESHIMPQAQLSTQALRGKTPETGPAGRVGSPGYRAEALSLALLPAFANNACAVRAFRREDCTPAAGGLYDVLE